MDKKPNDFFLMYFVGYAMVADTDPHWIRHQGVAGFGSLKNECGSATLIFVFCYNTVHVFLPHTDNTFFYGEILYRTVQGPVYYR